MSDRYDSDSAQRPEARRPDEETVRLWLDLEADGALDRSERERLEQAMSLYPELEAERRELSDLHHHLEATRIDVEPGFRATVMSSLPQAAWEPAGRRGWGMAAVVGLLLAIGGGLALAAGGVGAATSGPLVGVMVAVAEALGASVVTGAGLLGASWRGVGLALEELLASAPSAVLALAAGVVLLNLLFWRLLRRPVRSTLERRQR